MGLSYVIVSKELFEEKNEKIEVEQSENSENSENHSVTMEISCILNYILTD